MPAATAAPDLVPGSAAAAALGVSADYLGKLVRRGRIPGVRPSPRCLLIRRADLDAFRARREAHARAARLSIGLSVTAVAARCGVGADTVRRWIRLRLLPARLQPDTVGFYAYRVQQADLDRFLAAASTR